MNEKEKIYRKVIFINKNIKFSEIHYLLKNMGFTCRIKGDHYIYKKSGIREIINLQPLKNDGVKTYQLKQIKTIFLKYHLEV